MADYAASGPDTDTPVNPYSLLEAVNRSSDMAHTGWLIFLGVMAYLMIAVAGVTHKDLLLETPVQLPIFNIEVPQIQFFQFAPILLVLFHLGIVSQLVLLARKTLEFDLAVQQLETSVRRNHPLRLELHNFFFVQGIAGPHRSIVMGAFLHGMSWLTLVVIPVLLLLFIQIKFLPYHDGGVTWSHRIALMTDIAMMVLIGVFLLRPESSFLRAVWRSIAHYPIGFAVTVSVFLLVSLFSFFVATIPGEALDRFVQRMRTGTQAPQQASMTDVPAYVVGFAVPFFTSSADGSLFGIFHRNLIVPDTDLVSNRDVIAGESSLNLRDRDLRFAQLDRSDLHQADFTGANLEGASLVGADLRNVRLQCADVTLLILTDDREAARCAGALRADFTRADLSGARLAGADLRSAKFEEAKLDGTNLSYGLIAGANFSSASLDTADLTGGVQAQGANFLIASLNGADLTGAQLQFADFSSAAMNAATLAHAHLQSAVFRDTNLEGADLQRAKLHGADLTGAELPAADLRFTEIWMTAPPPADALSQADLTSATLAPPSPSDISQLKSAITRIEDRSLRDLVRESLRPLFETVAVDRWRNDANFDAWRSLIANRDIPLDDATYRTDLSDHLTGLACQRRWSDGSVATGVVKRALGQNFRGEPRSIYRRLSSDRCPPGAKVATNLMDEMSQTLEFGAVTPNEQ